MPELESGATEPAKSKKKDKDKVRSVWISFVGRIVAQIIGAIASVVLGIYVVQQYREQPAEVPAPVPPAVTRPPGARAVAVLPLDDFSPSPDDAYFAEGMTEVLISDLAQMEGWRVISRTSTETYRGTSKPLTQIARELNVNYVVEGSVTKAGDRVRVTVQLIDAGTDEHLFARSYDRTMKDVLALQGTLATEIAKSMQAAISPVHETRLAGRATVESAVFDLYLRGRHAWTQRTPQSLSAAERFFNDAIARAPNFALAHVGLADVHSMGGSPSIGAADAQRRMALARASAERALALDSQLAEAHTALGGVQFFGERNFSAAEQSFLRAIELNANYPVAHEWLAVLLAERGRDAEARRHVAVAVTLDPEAATMHQAQGFVHYYAGRFDDAIAAERRALERSPSLPLARTLLLKALVMKPDTAAAIAECEQGNLLASDQTDLLMVCGVALQRAGDARAAQIVTRLQAKQPLPESELAQFFASTGDIDRALTALRRLRAANNLPPAFAVDPLFASLRADRRYAAAVQ